MGGFGSRPWLSLWAMRPSRLWMRSLVSWLRLIWRPWSTACLLGIEMAGRALRATPIDVPAAAPMRHYMMGVGAFSCYHILTSFWTKIKSSTSTPNMMDLRNARCQASDVVLL